MTGPWECRNAHDAPTTTPDAQLLAERHGHGVPSATSGAQLRGVPSPWRRCWLRLMGTVCPSLQSLLRGWMG